MPGSAPPCGAFVELPGPAPDADARRQAFRAVMRRLLSTPPHDPEPDESEHHEEDDEETAA